MFHLELLQNIDHIPLAVQYTLEPILYPVVCSSNSFIPMLPLAHPPTPPVTTSLFFISLSASFLLYSLVCCIF